MHIYFCGIGGTGIGPLALIAKQAGYEVSGSDKQDSDYIHYLRDKGISNIFIGENEDNISTLHKNQPIDWFVYTSALPLENPNHPELVFCESNDIRATKRADLINKILADKNLKMLAVAGTHGKSTTTAMLVWCFKQLNIPVSYSVGAKLSFGEMGEYREGSEYFVYEADEFDRNFLEFEPAISLIAGIDYDHPDIYPTREDYYQAFRDFISQSSMTYLWKQDADKLNLSPSSNVAVLKKFDYKNVATALLGDVNRQNASLVTQAMISISDSLDLQSVSEVMNIFPGLSRRFEKITDNIYSDYAHTPGKIRGAIKTALELNRNLVVVYEGLHNTRQHFIKDELPKLFKGAVRLYVVPSYLAREDDNLEILTPEKLSQVIEDPSDTAPMNLDDNLRYTIKMEAESGNLVLCLSAGGGGSLDEWLRHEFSSSRID